MIGTAFAQPLVTRVMAVNPVEPVDGGFINYPPPASGASAALDTPVATIANGLAQTGATANNTLGSYPVTATTNGVISAPGSFTLTNILTPTVTTPAATSAVYSPADQTMTLTATVTSTYGTVEGGSVTFTLSRGGTVIGTPVTAPVSGGSASATFTLPGGTTAGDLTITADYDPGVTTFAASTGTSTLTAAKAGQTIAFTKNSPLVYGVAPITLTATATSGLPVSFTVVSGPGTLNGNVLTVTRAGTIVLQADQSGDGNYNPAELAQQTLIVTPAQLTVMADNSTRVYGQPNPTFTASYSGFVNGDDPSALGGTLAFDTAATTANGVGDYTVTPSGVTSANYVITFVDGTLSITPAPLTVTANDAERFFGRPNPTFTASFNGFLNGDAPADLTGTLALTTSAITSSAPGAYAITPSGLSAANYAITFVDGTLTVKPIVQRVAVGSGRRSAGPGV